MISSEHKRWCIKNCPCFEAENTVFWFLYGFHPNKNPEKFFKYIFNQNNYNIT